MNSRYKLRKGIALCQFDDCAVLLDIHLDRYWMLAGGSAAALVAIENGHTGAASAPIIDRLMARGLVERAGDDAEDSRPITSAQIVGARQSALVDGVGQSPGLDMRWAPQVAAAALAARYWVRNVPLVRLLDQVALRRKSVQRTPELSIEELARLHDHYRRWVPLPRVCLADSLAFVAVAARHGHHPRLVFGVVPSPFAAHCWVQDGDMVLNDALDHVTQFKPILAV